ncbi:MAG: regulator of chromosome condensation, RCC1 [uncultured bacterium (gcode 4)]|uniref:Regulator of chromosome condensation, RCC1 n=1 Tax=uncultured bacterium (gcode 4) TaxID=1234023 RepID=K2FZW8_9BACT|nr:MAG: regulator of chromosome condensation, RCC1 [uncultured bacterium (gcode 4)]
MYCWWLNSNRQLWDNTTTQSATPIQVKWIWWTWNLADISQISTWYSHACGVKTDWTIACWWLNSNGQLWNNSIILSGNPVNVVLPWVRNFTASQLWFGFYTSCGVQSDWSAFCWWSNNWGQVWDNVASPTNKSLPTQVVWVWWAWYLSDSSQITWSYSSTCSLKTDWTVYCWWWNGLGMLWDNTVTQRKAPVQVFWTWWVWTTLTWITQISWWNTHNCALKSNWTVYCWWDNTYGQIWDNTITQRRIPVQVMWTWWVWTTLTWITQVSAWDTHTCALKNDWTVYCWWENISGNLWINNTTNKRIPVQVLWAWWVWTTLTWVTQIFAGYYSTCALKSDKTVFCWWRNSTGQIWDGTLSAKYIPTQVKWVWWTWVLDEVVHIDGYMSVACAVKTAWTVFCWWYNYYGQLWNNTTTDESTPVQVKGGWWTWVLDGVSKIEVAYTHNCALKTDWTVHCWWRNNNGQLWDNSLNNSLTPVPTMLHSNIIWNIFN